MNKALKLLTFITFKTNYSSLWLLILSAITGGLAFEPFSQPIALFFSIYILLSNLQKQHVFKNFLKNTAIFCFFFFLSHLYWVCWAVNVNLPLGSVVIVVDGTKFTPSELTNPSGLATSTG